ncbi:MAG: hypothetical protein H6618_01420 [Deltaproteobacteria bacterium]|nr:hypothetical protein [Deltaproteobacteria bacterium]
MQHLLITIKNAGKSLSCLIIAPILGLSSCAGGASYSQMIVRNQASYDFDCPPSEIDVAPVGNHRFTAAGCFKKEMYECSSGIFATESSIECKQLLSPLPSLHHEAD